MADSASQRVLVVDDEASISDIVAFNLEREGYCVDVAVDGESALSMASSVPYDVYILDVMLPGMDGYELCRRLKRMSSAPVLFLSARDTEIDKVVGLETGGDDYLAKPFGMRELVARVRSLVRRSALREELSCTECRSMKANGVFLDEGVHVASVGDVALSLTPREFELLACLMRHAGVVMTREAILSEAWDWQYVTESKTVDTHIKRLRDKITAAGGAPDVIETVRGYGYSFRRDPVRP